MGDTTHDRVAKQIAKTLGAEYNPGKGVDINTPSEVIEIEPNPESFSEGIRQLQGYRKPRYLGVPKQHVPAAIERTKKTAIGVIDETGKIHKPAGKHRKKK